MADIPASHKNIYRKKEDGEGTQSSLNRLKPIPNSEKLVKATYANSQLKGYSFNQEILGFSPLTNATQRLNQIEDPPQNPTKGVHISVENLA